MCNSTSRSFLRDCALADKVPLIPFSLRYYYLSSHTGLLHEEKPTSSISPALQLIWRVPMWVITDSEVHCKGWHQPLPNHSTAEIPWQAVAGHRGGGLRRSTWEWERSQTSQARPSSFSHSGHPWRQLQFFTLCSPPTVSDPSWKKSVSQIGRWFLNRNDTKQMTESASQDTA